MDSLNTFRQERFYADTDEMPPLMYVSDEAVGRRHVPTTGVPLEGGPYASVPLVHASDANTIHDQIQRARPSLPSASNRGLRTRDQLPRASHQRTSADFAYRPQVLSFHNPLRTDLMFLYS